MAPLAPPGYAYAPTEKKKEYSTVIQEQAYQFSFDQAHRHAILLVVKKRKLKRRKNIQRQCKNMPGPD